VVRITRFGTCDAGHDVRVTLLAHAHAAPRAVLDSVSRSMGLLPRRPWLPAGETLRGRMFVTGSGPDLGVALLDEPGAVDVRVRLGYAPGLTGAGPLVSTLALRLDVEGRPADLFFATPPGTRAMPRKRRDDDCTVLTSRATYAAAGAPLLLAARACGSETLELLCRDAGPDGGWRGIADLRVSPYPLGEPPLAVDPIARPLPGLTVVEAGSGRAV